MSLYYSVFELFAEWFDIFESIREAIFLFSLCAPWEQLESVGSIKLPRNSSETQMCKNMKTGPLCWN